MSNKPTRHPTHIDEARHACEYVVSYVLMRHLAQIDEACHAYTIDEATKGFVGAGNMRDMSHSYVRHDSFICVTWLIHIHRRSNERIRGRRKCLRHDLFICAAWLIHMCDVTHSYTQTTQWKDSWDEEMCDMMNSYVRHDSFICVTWLMHIHRRSNERVRGRRKCVWHD